MAAGSVGGPEAPLRAMVHKSPRLPCSKYANAVVSDSTEAQPVSIPRTVQDALEVALHGLRGSVAHMQQQAAAVAGGHLQ